MQDNEPPLRDVLAALYARATMSGKYADARLTRGLNLRAAPQLPGQFRTLLIWRGADEAPPSDNEALKCATAAGFPAYDVTWAGGGRARLITEREATEQEQRDAERYKAEPAQPFRPGRPTPTDGDLRLNTLYHLDTPGGLVTFYFRAAGGPLQVRGPHSTLDVAPGRAGRFLGRLGYQPQRLTLSGRLL